jgi:hypothetical protein
MTIVNDKVTTALRAVESSKKGHWFPGMGNPVSMDKVRATSRKLANVYTGVGQLKTRPVVVPSFPKQVSTGNELLDNLTTHFGVLLASRIFACALIQGEKLAEREGMEEMDEGDYVRFTIGMVKRMRRQAIENGQSMTWENAIERLEHEQVEGRHYSFKSTLGRAFSSQVKAEENRIKAREGAYKAEAKESGVSVWSLKVEVEAERLQEDMSTKAVNASDVSMMLIGIMSKWTTRRRAWFVKVMDGLRNGAELTASQRATITGDYAPQGVTATEFVELVARYA